MDTYFIFYVNRPPPRSTLFPYTTLFRSTSVTNVNTDLGSNDGQTDQVNVNSTAEHTPDVISPVTVSCLAAHVAVTGEEPTDILAVDGLAGDDAFHVDGSLAPLDERLIGS